MLLSDDYTPKSCILPLPNPVIGLNFRKAVSLESISPGLVCFRAWLSAPEFRLVLVGGTAAITVVGLGGGRVAQAGSAMNPPLPLPKTTMMAMATTTIMMVAARTRSVHRREGGISDHHHQLG
jgi:hypothetical protein